MFNKIKLEPKNVLLFELNRASSNSSALSVNSFTEPSSRCELTIRHPGQGRSEYLAFKIKSTNPKRYLVRPHQGLVAPYESQKVTILMIEKEKNMLLDEHCSKKKTNMFGTKDKFLVQSYYVSRSLINTEQYTEHALTIMWGTVSKFKFTNNTLSVRCTVVDFAMSTTSSIVSSDSFSASYDRQSGNGLGNELSSLRKRYADLSSFSEHLLAERDRVRDSVEENRMKLDRVRIGLPEDTHISNWILKMAITCVLIISCFMIGIYLGFRNKAANILSFSGN